MKKDILATINCDSEAMDKFLRQINGLERWKISDRPELNLAVLQDTKESAEALVKEFLGECHLMDYYEAFLVFSRCQEWWSKLPEFSDEEMRIWLGMDKPGHLIRLRTLLRERWNVEKVERGIKGGQEERKKDHSDLSIPVDLRQPKDAEEILVLFQGALARLCINRKEIRIESVDEGGELKRHHLKELLFVYQDGEDLTKFGYQLVDESCWVFQTASIVTTARAVLVIATQFGF